MAEQERIEIVVDAGDSERVLKKLSADLTGVGKSADKTAKDLDLTGAALDKIKQFAAPAALILFMRQASNTAAKFESAMADLSAITGATGDDLKFLADASLEFGKTTTLSASQAAEAFKLIASAKPDLLENKEALKAVTKETITLAEAAGIDLASAAKTVGGSLNQFGEDANQAARFVNVLAAGAKFGSSEIYETAEALKNAGVSAAGANISFEETNAAIQELAKSSIKGAEAGTALRNIILKLETSGKDKLTPSINGLAGSLKNFNELNLSAAERVKFFGLENINAADAILKQADSMTELEIKLTDTNTAYDQAKTKSNTLEGDQKSLASAFEALQITLGNKLNPTLRTTTQLLTEITKAIDSAFKTKSVDVDPITQEIQKLEREYNNLEKTINSLNTAYAPGQQILNEEKKAEAIARQNEILKEQERLREKLKNQEDEEEEEEVSATTKKKKKDKVDEVVEPTASEKAAKERAQREADSLVESLYLATLSREELLDQQYQNEFDKLIEFQKKKLISEEEFNRSFLNLEAKYSEKRKQLEEKNTEESKKSNEQLLNGLAMSTQQAADAVSAFAGEQNSVYAALFGLQKGYVIASSALNIEKAISDGWASGTSIYEKVAAVGVIVANTASIMGSIKAITYSGARQTGGAVSGGNRYKVNEMTPELFTDGRSGEQFLTVPEGGSGKITRLDNQGSSAMGGVNVTIENYGPPLSVESTQQLSESDYRIIAREEASSEIAAQSRNRSSSLNRNQDAMFKRQKRL